jgi:hypothetical protein
MLTHRLDFGDLTAPTEWFSGMSLGRPGTKSWLLMEEIEMNLLGLISRPSRLLSVVGKRWELEKLMGAE